MRRHVLLLFLTISTSILFFKSCDIDNPQPKDCSIIEVTVKNMTAGDTKDIIFHDEKNNYHINRGLDLGINLESLNAKVLNKTVSLYVPKMLFCTSKHISQITLGKEIIFTEFN